MVAGADPEDVVAIGQVVDRQRASGEVAVAHHIADHVAEPRHRAAVHGDAAVLGVGDLRRVRLRRHAVELDVHARLFVAGQRAAVGVEDLVAQRVQAEAAARQVAVHLVPGLDHQLQAAGVARHPQAAVAAFAQALAAGVEQGDVVDAWRHVVGVIGEAQPYRIALVTGWPDRQVHVGLAVDAAQRIAGVEAGTAAHAHPLQLPGLVVHQLEAGRIERLVARVAADLHVDVVDGVQRQALGLPAQAPGRRRAADLGCGDGEHGLADVAADVEATVQVVAAFAAEVAAHFAQGADHFVPAQLRCQRPAPLVARQRVVHRRPDRRFGRRHSRHRQPQVMEAVGIGVAEQQAAIGRQRDARRAREALRIAGHRHHMPRRRHLHHAAGDALADIGHAVVGERQRHRPPQHARAPGTAGARRDAAAAGHGAQRVVAQVGHPQRAVGGEREVGGSIETRRLALAVGPAGAAAAGQRPHPAVRLDHADAVVPGVGHVHPPLRIHRHAHRPVETRLPADAIGEPGHAVAGQCADVALRGDLADRMVAGIGDIQVAVAVQRQPGGRVERGGVPAPVGEALAAAGQHVEHAVQPAVEDAVVVAGIGNIKRAAGVHRHAPGIAEAAVHAGTDAVAFDAVAGQQRNLRAPAQRRGGRRYQGRPWRPQIAGRERAPGQQCHDHHPMPAFHVHPSGCGPGTIDARRPRNHPAPTGSPPVPRSHA